MRRHAAELRSHGISSLSSSSFGRSALSSLNSCLRRSTGPYRAWCCLRSSTSDERGTGNFSPTSLSLGERVPEGRVRGQRWSLVAALLAALACTLGAAPTSLAQRQPLPSIILISVDTLRAD